MCCLLIFLFFVLQLPSHHHPPVAGGQKRWLWPVLRWEPRYRSPPKPNRPFISTKRKTIMRDVLIYIHSFYRDITFMTETIVSFPFLSFWFFPSLNHKLGNGTTQAGFMAGRFPEFFRLTVPSIATTQPCLKWKQKTWRLSVCCTTTVSFPQTVPHTFKQQPLHPWWNTVNVWKLKF